MGKRFISLAAAAGFLRVAALAAPSPFAGADVLLDQAEANLGALERCVESREDLQDQIKRLRRTPAPAAPQAPLLAPPKPDPSLRADAADKAYAAKKTRLLEDCGGGGAPKEIAASRLAAWEPGNAIPFSLTYYFTCLAAAGQGPAACEILKDMPPQAPSAGVSFGGPRSACLYHAQRLHMSRLLISRAPTFLEACREAEGIAPRENSDYFCRMILRGEDNPAGICGIPRIKAIQDPGERSGPGCEVNLRYLWGTGKACVEPGPGAQRGPQGPQSSDSLEGRLGCLDSAGPRAFRKAFAGHDVSLCGASSFCRAMMGEGPSACEGLARRVMEDKTRFCAAVARWPEKAPPDQQTVLLEVEKRRTEWLRETERYGREAARLAVEYRKAADAAEAEVNQGFLKAEALHAKLEAADKVCFKLEAEASDLLRRGFAVVDGVEPKSIPGFKERRQRYAEMMKRAAELEGRIHQAPPAKKKAPRRPRGGGRIP